MKTPKLFWVLLVLVFIAAAAVAAGAVGVFYGIALVAIDLAHGGFGERGQYWIVWGLGTVAAGVVSILGVTYLGELLPEPPDNKKG